MDVWVLRHFPHAAVSAKRRWCSADGKVTAGLAESNGSLPSGEWLMYQYHLLVDCLYTPGSAPGPTLGNEYEKPLHFYCINVYCLLII